MTTCNHEWKDFDGKDLDNWEKKFEELFDVRFSYHQALEKCLKCGSVRECRATDQQGS